MGSKGETGLLERLKNGEVLISDGAVGTYLQGRGLEIGQAPETWNLTHPEVVENMALDYFEAGSDLVATNSFGGNRFRLAHQGLEGQVDEVNRKAAEIVRASAREGGIVVGSVGPTGEFLAPLGLVTPSEMFEAFSRQMEALADGGVDAVCIETMTALEEATLAVEAAGALGLPVMATMTFDLGPKGFATSMGVTIAQAVEGLSEAGADVIGANCGSGIEQMVEIAKEMGKLTDRPLMVQSNAGMPELQDGVAVYTETPEKMASYVDVLVAAGTRIIGGCCGTGPGHIAAMAKVIKGKSR